MSNTLCVRCRLRPAVNLRTDLCGVCSDEIDVKRKREEADRKTNTGAK